MNSQGLYDTGYANLLSILRDSNPRLPYETIYAGISHYLAEVPISTSLAASVIASPLWQHPTRKQLFSLANAFSNATRIKMSSLAKEKRGIFETSVSSRFARWIRNVLSGLEGGVPPLLISVSLGLREGINLSQKPKEQNTELARDVEDIIILGLAETLETTDPQSGWEREFARQSHSRLDGYSKSILAVLARYQTHISSEMLQRLDLFNLAGKLIVEVQKAFDSEFFGRAASSADSRSAPSNYEETNDPASMQFNERFEDVAFDSKLLARAVVIVGGSASTPRKRKSAWELLTNLAGSLYDTCAKLDRDWSSEHFTDSDTMNRDGGKQLWDALKVLLFSTLMIQQAILDVILFLPPVRSSAEPQASSLTGAILRTLFSLSTAIDSFGGISDTGSGARSFPELKKVFYTAVDIKAVDERGSEILVRDLILKLRSTTASQRYLKAKRAFVLACAEQFVAVLSNETLENHVVPLCEPYLADSSTRETFEASHSVMLSIFATYADKASNDTSWSDPAGMQMRNSDLIVKLVPGYCQYLLKPFAPLEQSAQEGGLTTPQLRLAYATLARGTSARTNRGNRQSAHPTNENHTASHLRAAGAKLMSEGAALTWLCIDLLLSHIATAACPRSKQGEDEIVQALRLTLISLVPCVNIELLPKLLQAVEDSILNSVRRKDRDGLIQAVYDEMLERVGDREKEVTMNWWFALRRKLEEDSGPGIASEVSHYEKREIQVQSRI